MRKRKARKRRKKKSRNIKKIRKREDIQVVVQRKSKKKLLSQNLKRINYKIKKRRKEVQMITEQIERIDMNMQDLMIGLIEEVDLEKTAENIPEEIEEEKTVEIIIVEEMTKELESDQCQDPHPTLHLFCLNEP
jgi:hypothetical protein